MAFYPPNGGGGGAGNPSLPFNSIQYNNNGNFFGDSNATRDPLTQQTGILRTFSGGQHGGLSLRENAIFGVSPFAGVSWNDASQGINTFNGISDTSPLGGTENTTFQALVNTVTYDTSVAVMNGDQTLGFSYFANVTNTAFSATQAAFGLDPYSLGFAFEDSGQGTTSEFILNSVDATIEFNDGTNTSGLFMSGLDNRLTYINGITGSSSKAELHPDYAFFGFQNGNTNESSYFLAGHFKTSVTFQTSALGPTVLTELNAGMNGTMYLWDTYHHFEINVPLFRYQLGDIDGQNNQSYIEIQDYQQSLTFKTGIRELFRSSPASSFIISHNGTGMTVEDTSHSVKFEGGEYWLGSIVVDSTSYTVQPRDRVIYVDTTQNPVTITLPPILGNEKRMITIKDIGDAMSNPITINASTGDTVEVSSIAVTGSALTYQSIDQTYPWYVISKY